MNGFFTNKIVVAVALVLGLVAVAARGQTAPAGNEHPESHALNEEAAELPSPFGEPVMSIDGRMTPEQKHAFAASVDLRPLEGLAVFHNGRVKVLDTLASETVGAIVGRKDYFDMVEEGGEFDKARYAPVFTLLDLVIDPMYYVDKPLIHVNYLPLRRAYLGLAFPGDSEAEELARQRLMKLGRITPVMAQRFGERIQREHEFEPAWRQANGRVAQAMGLWQQSSANLLLIAPESAADSWHHVSEWPTDSEVRGAFAALGEAWRAGDADGVNAAAQEIAAVLPTINSEMYPTGRAQLEIAYNRSNAFEWGYWLYFLGFLGLLLSFGTGRKWLLVGGMGFVIAATLLHATGFTMRCVIAERFAIQNQFESMTGISLFAAVVGLALAFWKKQWLFAAAAAGTGFLVLITATQTGIPGVEIEREAAILNTSVLLKYHVTTVLVSYGLITLGFIVSLFYLGTYYIARFQGRLGVKKVEARGSTGAAMVAGPESIAAKALGAEKPAGIHRTLADLDTAQMTILQLAFWTLGVGILLGAWWADHSWGRWWAFDPKETWALITWIVYLIVIHVRQALGQKKGIATAWLSVAGFFVMLFTYFGVNLLLPGLHAYA